LAAAWGRACQPRAPGALGGGARTSSSRTTSWSFSALRATTITSAPCSASWRAAERPMPSDAPVTRTVYGEVWSALDEGEPRDCGGRGQYLALDGEVIPAEEAHCAERGGADEACGCCYEGRRAEVRHLGFTWVCVFEARRRRPQRCDEVVSLVQSYAAEPARASTVDAPISVKFALAST